MMMMMMTIMSSLMIVLPFLVAGVDGWTVSLSLVKHNRRLMNHLSASSSSSSVAAASQRASNKDEPQQQQKLQVTPLVVDDPRDVIALADLRYREWIMPKDDDDDNDVTSTTNAAPSLQAFRMATKEICDERRAATVFLARYYSSDKDVVVVGAAELSPIELEGCYDNNDSARTSTTTLHNDFLYVTDVVTASTHRQGIAATIMHVLEDHAATTTTTTSGNNHNNVTLLLHVEPTNHAAVNFYKKRLGYQEYHHKNHHDADANADIIATATTATLQQLNVNRLAENASVDPKQQLLLYKTIIRTNHRHDAIATTASASTITNARSQPSSANGGGGFGQANHNSSKRKTRHKKKKR